jgi:tetratricopeptide (TPR) repeat protein
MERQGLLGKADGSVNSRIDVSLSGREREWARLAVFMVLAAALVTATHWRAISARALCFDDVQYVLGNPLVRNPSLASVSKFVTEVTKPSSVAGYYQPVTMTSLMIDFLFAGRRDDLGFFHGVSLGLHVCNTLLLILLMHQLFGRAGPAVLTGLLFGVHPLTVESIPWLAERKTLLAAFFALASLNAYVMFARRKQIGWWIGCAVLYGLACLSKPTAIPLPIVFLLLDYWPLRSPIRPRLHEKLPLFALMIVFGVITIISQARTAGAGLQGENVVMTALLTVCHNIVFYLRKIAWPTNLTPFYPYPEPFDLSQPALKAGLIGTATLAIVTVLSMHKTRAVATGVLIFLALLAPTLQLVGFTLVIASDKYVYLPLVGLLLLTCRVLCAAWGDTTTFARRGLLTIGALFVVFALAANTRAAYEPWRHSTALHRHMLTHAPSSGIVHDLLASDLVAEGKLDEAFELQQKAVALSPAYPAAHHNLGGSLLRMGRFDDAVKSFEEAIRLKPDYALPRLNMANMLLTQGKLAEAVAMYSEVIRVEPSLPEGHYGLGNALFRLGKGEEAAWSYVQAIFLRPGYADAHVQLGLLLMESGSYGKAAENFQEALRHNPNHLAGRNGYARCLERLGRRSDALEEYRQVLRLNPDDALARRAVDNITGKVGKISAGKSTSRPDTLP